MQVHCEKIVVDSRSDSENRFLNYQHVYQVQRAPLMDDANHLEALENQPITSLSRSINLEIQLIITPLVSVV